MKGKGIAVFLLMIGCVFLFTTLAYLTNHNIDIPHNNNNNKNNNNEDSNNHHTLTIQRTLFEVTKEKNSQLTSGQSQTLDDTPKNDTLAPLPNVEYFPVREVYIGILVFGIGGFFGLFVLALKTYFLYVEKFNTSKYAQLSPPPTTPQKQTKPIDISRNPLDALSRSSSYKSF